MLEKPFWLCDLGAKKGTFLKFGLQIKTDFLNFEFVYCLKLVFVTLEKLRLLCVFSVY